MVNISVALLPEDIKAAIEKWAQQYPAEQRQSAVLPALLIAQDYNKGWLSTELIEAVADYLAMPRATAYEVATFYSMYELRPVGRHKIGVCTNISCMLNNCGAIIKKLKARLKINFGETTPDGRFTLKEVECLGACINAPVIYLNRHYYENVTPQKVDEILDRLD